ncbi:ABC transporter ATP-binding protein [Nostoc sp.]|uniref:ABC transporter ATP-binding protein n=1 Tax=Nostoc sp. TaxID=1180 RepID=UPI002FF84C0F
MSDTVIQVENLGKKYIIGHQQQERYTALRDVIANKVKSLGTLIQNPKSKIQNSQEEFWALKDVSFEIKQGDRVGIIGRNGAGKSTLLKILSRITEPTEGSIKIKGRVASLLEVGTGFHPELTGRENIYLNGAILGMSRVDIKRKFDEIVAFAEVEKFLDTPVKRYSSGMYVRLAFAVAAHLEPEVLIVDEVLAVGDAQFQKKCLGKMEDVGQEGRTVLFVSHNMSAIQAICKRSLVLSLGHLVADANSSEAVKIYLQDSLSSNSFNRKNINQLKPQIISGKIIKNSNDYIESKILVEVNIFTPTEKTISLDIRVKDCMGIAVGFGSLGTLNPKQILNINTGINVISFSFPIDKFAVGSYIISLDLTLPDAEFYDRVEEGLRFDVNRPPNNGYIRVLNQSWGYGSFEIPLNQIDCSITDELASK